MQRGRAPDRGHATATCSDGRRDGQFRADLYYRLERVPDRDPAAARAPERHPAARPPFHSALYARSMGRARSRPIPRAVMEALVHYAWPGNVRELQNVIERAVILSPEGRFELGDMVAAAPRGGSERSAAQRSRMSSVNTSPRFSRRPGGGSAVSAAPPRSWASSGRPRGPHEEARHLSSSLIEATPRSSSRPTAPIHHAHCHPIGVFPTARHSTPRPLHRARGLSDPQIDSLQLLALPRSGVEKLGTGRAIGFVCRASAIVPSRCYQGQDKENTMKKLLLVALTALVLSSPTISTAAPVVFEASGATPADIQAAVDDFRAFLGALNPNVAGSFPDGRREINWDGVPGRLLSPEQSSSQLLQRQFPARRRVLHARGPASR